MDIIKTWTGLPVEESIGMIEDRDKRGKYVPGVANPRIEDGKRTEQRCNYSAPDREAEYCDVRVCLYVCLCVSASISPKIHV